MSQDADLAAASAALIELTIRNIPPDVQELLVNGSMSRGVACLAELHPER